MLTVQDHVLFGASFDTNIATHARLQDPVFAAAQTEAYIKNRTGVLTNTASDFVGWEKLPSTLRRNLKNSTLAGLALLPSDWPELELIFPDGYGGYLTDFLADGPLDGKNYASVGAGLQATFSRGFISINSSDTAINPIVNPNLLGDQRDLDVAVQALRRIRQIANTTALRNITIGEEAFPGVKVQTDDEIKAWLMTASNTICHAACTNAMGKSNDLMAVVDSEARVFGVSRLRVVDASIFPFLPPGHPQSLVCKFSSRRSMSVLKTDDL